MLFHLPLADTANTTERLFDVSGSAVNDFAKGTREVVLQEVRDPHEPASSVALGEYLPQDSRFIEGATALAWRQEERLRQEAQRSCEDTSSKEIPSQNTGKTGKNGPMEFHRLTSKEELADSFPLMRELRTHLTPQTYLELLEEMAAEGYELWALSSDGGMKALAGIAFRTNLYYGRYVWVFDLVTRASERSAGYGAALLNHIEHLADQRGCDVVALASGLERLDAHRFYEDKMGYERPSFVFKKPLRDPNP